jgi:glycerophosphoryl diester phosphodiesterase
MKRADFPGKGTASGISRRQALGLGAAGICAAGLVLAGCSGPGEDSDANAEEPAAATHTIESMLASAPFLIAHRGSWDNWPEHTMAAYLGAAEAGAVAIEISVCATSDGKLVCHHDLDSQRTTGRKLVIKDTTYAELSELRVDARQWLGPNAPLEKIPLLSDVLNALADSHVLFIEDKQGTNTTELLDLMDSYPNSREHLIWKQPAVAGQVEAATRRGYATWGYFTRDQLDQVPSLHEKFTYLGVHHSAGDDELASVVSLGKPVICWEVHTRELRDRLLSLGVAGLMCANLPYLARDESKENADRFADGLRAAGDLPWTVGLGWAFQPQIKPDSASLLMSEPANSSYRMGSMAPVQRDVFSIAFEMRWPETLPVDNSLHAGLAFGQDLDLPYRVLVPGDVGGYHLVIRPTGQMTLLLRHPGEAGGLRLGMVDTAAAVPGKWMSFRLDMAPDGIRYSRLDGEGWAGMSPDRRYRGGYFSLCRNYAEPTPVEFRAVKVS